jgi:uncharacterized membrane protein YeaQ/YmgE (transglycosylase-associated protein family)
MIFSLIGFLIVALIAGRVARMLVPGQGRMSIRGTTALGVAGSFMGGFLGWLLFNKDKFAGAMQTAGFFGSVLGAVIVLVLYRKYGNGAGSAKS